MAWWRGVLKFLCSVILIASLITFVLFLTASNATSEQTIKPVFMSVFESSLAENLSQDNITILYIYLNQSCTGESMKFPMSESENLTLKCSEINEAGASGIIDFIGGEAFDSFYQKDTGVNSANLVSSIKSNPSAIISKSAHDALRTSAFLFLWIAIAMVIAIFFLSVPKLGSFICLGIDFLIAGLFYFLIKVIGPGFIDGFNLEGQIKDSVMPIVQKLLSGISGIFLMFLVIGIILLVAGIITLSIMRKKANKKSAKKLEKSSKK